MPLFWSFDSTSCISLAYVVVWRDYVDWFNSCKGMLWGQLKENTWYTGPALISDVQICTWMTQGFSFNFWGPIRWRSVTTLTRGKQFFLLGRSMEAQGMARITNASCRADLGVQWAGFWGGVVAHTDRCQANIFYKMLQFTLIKVNSLQAVLMVRHHAPLCPLTFGGSSVSGPSALEGTALPWKTKRKKNLKKSKVKLLPVSEEREIFINVLADETSISCSQVCIVVSNGWKTCRRSI